MTKLLDLEPRTAGEVAAEPAVSFGERAVDLHSRQGTPERQCCAGAFTECPCAPSTVA